MKPISVLVFTFIFVLTSSAQIQKYEWNTPKETIKQQEDRISSEKNHLLVYRDKWAGFDIKRRHDFVDNKLARTTIIIQNTYSDNNNYIADFEKLNERLNRKFGSPLSSDARIVLNPSLADEQSMDEGEKLFAGAVGFQTKWKNARTTIRHTMRGNNYEVIHVIVFVSPDFKNHNKPIADDK